MTSRGSHSVLALAPLLLGVGLGLGILGSAQAGSAGGGDGQGQVAGAAQGTVADQHVRSPATGRREDVSTPLHVKLTLDHVPVVGETAAVLCEVWAAKDAPGTIVTIELPAAAIVLQGDVRWQGDVLVDTPVVVSVSFQFKEPGRYAIRARALRPVNAGNIWGDLGTVYITVGLKEGQLGFVPEAAGPPNLVPGVMLRPGDGTLVSQGPVAGQPIAAGKARPAPPSVEPSLFATPQSRQGARAAAVTAGTLTITGNWSFADRNDQAAYEEFLVEIVRGDTGAHLAYCFSDLGGEYSCGPFTNPGGVGVASKLYAWTNFNPQPDTLAVVNPDLGTTNALTNAYAAATPAYSYSDGTHDIGDWWVPPGNDNRRAWWIENDVIRTWKYIFFGAGISQNPVETSGPCTVQWKIASTDGNYYNGGGNVHLNGDAPLSTTVVGHEYGHNIMWTVYGGWFPTTYCPSPHYIESTSHVNCAWTEGFAEFLPMVVNNDPYYRWSSGAYVNLETPTWGTGGWDNGDAVEGRVAGALWDMFDTSNDGWDTYSDGGIANFWDTLFHQADNNFAEYWAAWQARGHAFIGPLDAIFQDTINYCVSGANVTTSPVFGGSPTGLYSILLSWTAVTNATHYQVWRADASGVIYDGQGFSYPDSGLSPGTTHRYWVRGYNACSTGSWSGYIDVTTCSIPPVPVLAAPTYATSGATYAVTWTATSTDNTYEIQESTDPGFSGAATISVTGTSRNFSHTVAATATYYYRVRAKVLCASSTWLSNWSATKQTLVDVCYVNLANQTITWTSTQSSCSTLMAGPAFRVASPGNVTFHAATSVILANGFSVGPGATFTAGLDPSLAP